MDDDVHGPIRLRLVEHVPFPLWDREEFLGDDFAELHAWLGITRATYDRLAGLQRDFEAAHQHLTPELAATARSLADQLAAELNGRFEVRYQP
jgi:hypothetical protein